MPLPAPLPDRKFPGWLYALLFLIAVSGYVGLIIAGHANDAAGYIAIVTPVLGAVFVADRVTGVSRDEGHNTRQAIKNGALTEGLLNALDHPDVQDKIVRLTNLPNPPAKKKVGP